MRHTKAAGELTTHDVFELPAGEGMVGVHATRSILRMRSCGMTITLAVDGERHEVPLPDADVIQVTTGTGHKITLPASQVVEVL